MPLMPKPAASAVNRNVRVTLPAVLSGVIVFKTGGSGGGAAPELEGIDLKHRMRTATAGDEGRFDRGLESAGHRQIDDDFGALAGANANARHSSGPGR